VHKRDAKPVPGVSKLAAAAPPLKPTPVKKLKLKIDTPGTLPGGKIAVRSG